MNKTDLLRQAKPILFNTEMVKAILDGRKTQTRRVVKFKDNKNPNWTGWVKDGLNLYNGRNEVCNKKPPYNVGDVMYVRETWAWCPCWHCGYDMNEKTANDKCFDSAAHRIYNKKRAEYGCYEYKAGNPSEVSDFDGKWKPSIHMPKEAARIFLKVTDVRVERLQDITDEQAKAEGANWKIGCNVGFTEKCQRSAIDRFADLWDSTIKKANRDKYGWDANPYVWVVEFERLKVEEYREL